MRFVFVKRNLEDNMLRIYMRKYLNGNSYAYDLQTIKEHIVWYHEMIDLLVEKFPEIAMVVRYEDMVTDPALVLGRVAELCGLPEPALGSLAVGDDRGCAAPYREYIQKALGSRI